MDIFHSGGKLKIIGFFQGDEKNMTTDQLIVCSDEILSGTPVFKGTRVPVKNLIDCLEAGDSLEEFLDDFPSVTRKQAVQVLELAKKMLLGNIHASAH